MRNRLSNNPAKPRFGISLPGYPTLAAASFYLCLSSGCGSGTSTNDFPPNNGTAPPTFDASKPADAQDAMPNPTGKIAAPFDASPPDTQSTPNPAGFAALPFDAAPQEDAVPPPDLAAPADLAPESPPSQPPLAGGAPMPFDNGDVD